MMMTRTNAMTLMVMRISSGRTFLITIGEKYGIVVLRLD
jgi:hypothetical protein